MTYYTPNDVYIHAISMMFIITQIHNIILGKTLELKLPKH